MIYRGRQGHGAIVPVISDREHVFTSPYCAPAPVIRERWPRPVAPRPPSNLLWQDETYEYVLTDTDEIIIIDNA